MEDSSVGPDWMPKLSGRPLVLLDLDEVVIEFAVPFDRFLRTKGLRLELSRFLNPHNVLDPRSSDPVSAEAAGELLDEFSSRQWEWQGWVTGAETVLAELQTVCDIAYLSAADRRFIAARQRLLQQLGLTAPLIMRSDKHVVASMLRPQVAALAFVDDTPANLAAVRDAVPDALCLHFASHEPFRAVLATMWPAQDVYSCWKELAERLRTFAERSATQLGGA